MSEQTNWKYVGIDTNPPYGFIALVFENPEQTDRLYLRQTEYTRHFVQGQFYTVEEIKEVPVI
jgi:hypothetical protein